jgi:hypothetical protein
MEILTHLYSTGSFIYRRSDTVPMTDMLHPLFPMQSGPGGYLQNKMPKRMFLYAVEMVTSSGANIRHNDYSNVLLRSMLKVSKHWVGRVHRISLDNPVHPTIAL